MKIGSFNSSGNAANLRPMDWSYKPENCQVRKSIKEYSKLFVNSDWLQFFLGLPPLTIKERVTDLFRALYHQNLTLCAVSANCWALFFSSSVFSSARPSLSPRSFKAWLAFCTALVTLSAAEWSMLFPAIAKETIRTPKYVYALY